MRGREERERERILHHSGQALDVGVDMFSTSKLLSSFQLSGPMIASSVNTLS